MCWDGSRQGTPGSRMVTYWSVYQSYTTKGQPQMAPDGPGKPARQPRSARIQKSLSNLTFHGIPPKERMRHDVFRGRSVECCAKQTDLDQRSGILKLTTGRLATREESSPRAAAGTVSFGRN